jgi:hypothetical protein
MKTKKLYSRNHSVLISAINEIANQRIVKFKTQAALHCLLEDIKNPLCKRLRNGKVSKPAYSQDNYEPIVDWMLSHGLLNKVEGYRKNVIAYEVTALLPLYSLRMPKSTYTIKYE